MGIDVCVKIGRKIRLIRTERGISQSILADQARLSRINLSRIENGKAEPGIRTLYDIAQAFGIKLRDLVDGID